MFRHYGDRVRIVPFRRNNVSICAHYSMRKGQPTNQWQDCCIQAGIREPWDLRLEWKPETVLDGPYICVALPRDPMGRKDGFGKELLPDCRRIQRCIEVLRKKYRIVQIGAGKPLYEFTGIDLDLANRTPVGQLLDVAHGASGFLGYCSYMVPMAEGFDKPALFVWSRRGLRAGHLYVRQITPQKILSKPSSHWVMDDATQEELDDKCALLQL